MLQPKGARITLCPLVNDQPFWKSLTFSLSPSFLSSDHFGLPLAFHSTAPAYYQIEKSLTWGRPDLQTSFPQSSHAVIKFALIAAICLRRAHSAFVVLVGALVKPHYYHGTLGVVTICLACMTQLLILSRFVRFKKSRYIICYVRELSSSCLNPTFIGLKQFSRSFQLISFGRTDGRSGMSGCRRSETQGADANARTETAETDGWSGRKADEGAGAISLRREHGKL